ncbi:ribosomal RNA small subunit methyltransferase I [Babesia caballi]|uniref:Ribosomal RNA small subunit methyltransferase I n=1 Tax=Babesia caballi TaxID=5871 RepID=A0AAV4M2F0_BABCB|nr:ribosomal RNA small subunit methyltransferase I [Babesia caballi]
MPGAERLTLCVMRGWLDEESSDLNLDANPVVPGTGQGEHWVVDVDGNVVVGVPNAVGSAWNLRAWKPVLVVPSITGGVAADKVVVAVVGNVEVGMRGVHFVNDRFLAAFLVELAGDADAGGVVLVLLVVDLVQTGPTVAVRIVDGGVVLVHLVRKRHLHVSVAVGAFVAVKVLILTGVVAVVAVADGDVVPPIFVAADAVHFLVRVAAAVVFHVLVHRVGHVLIDVLAVSLRNALLGGERLVVEAFGIRPDLVLAFAALASALDVVLKLLVASRGGNREQQQGPNDGAA